jgi:hypothetical protein
MLSPSAAFGPTRGTTCKPGVANRLPNCDRQITEGVFAEKGTEKYTIGTEVGGKCVMFEELSGCPIAVVLGKTHLPGTWSWPVRFNGWLASGCDATSGVRGFSLRWRVSDRMKA